MMTTTGKSVAVASRPTGRDENRTRHRRRCRRDLNRIVMIYRVVGCRRQIIRNVVRTSRAVGETTTKKKKTLHISPVCYCFDVISRMFPFPRGKNDIFLIIRRIRRHRLVLYSNIPPLLLLLFHDIVPGQWETSPKTFARVRLDDAFARVV